jgi:ABC-type multidrug transport system permease subunit
MNPRRYHPLKELIFLRTKEFFREPEAIFWVYVFPILLMVGLGMAFRGSRDTWRVAVVAGPGAEEARQAFATGSGFEATVLPLEEARARSANGEVDLILDARGGELQYLFDPARVDSRAARLKANDVLQAQAGRSDPRPVADVHLAEPGSRYIDWLIPGLIGMNIMGGGLWGLGFITVDLRMRKLLKRFVATPMRRSDFLLSLMVSRLLFLIPEVVAILLAGRLIFGLEVKGSLLSVAAVALLGAACFSGIGLLIGSRTSKIETISGLLNLIMLPMWIFSGTFFSARRFPDPIQPFVQALPLTQLNNALRAVILEGTSASSQWLPALVLGTCGALAFAGALRWFRWL